jgi:predicted phosphodiesterase
MKIKLLSDLHAEFWPDRTIPPAFLAVDADVLIIAGDLGVGRDMVRDLLSQFSGIYPRVIFVPGNHEFYNNYMSCLDGLETPSNVHILNPGVVKIGDITFIGAPLWTNFNNDPISMQAARSMISDFTRIKGSTTGTRFTPADAVFLHARHEAFITESYLLHTGKKVIITHFLPARECIDPKYKGSNINDYYANNMGDWISNLTDVPYWFFGHTHSSVDVMIGETRLMANPFGYIGYDTNRNFNPVLTVEV